MIKWKRTAMQLPMPGREIIAKNPLKAAPINSAAKQCKVLKFHPSFTDDQILSAMMENDENLSLWCYTEGVCND